MSKTLSKAQEIGLRIKALNSEVCAIHDLVDEKQGGVAESAQVDEVKAKNKEIEALEKEYQQTQEWHQSQENADARKQAAEQLASAGIHPKAVNAVLKAAEMTWGERFVANEDFQAFVATKVIGSDVRKAQFGQSPVIPMGNVVTGASSTSGGALVVNDRTRIVDPGTVYRGEYQILDLITKSTTDSDTVDFVRTTTSVNNAAGVAEATGSGDGSGTKPESDWVTELVSTPVVTIAHWIPATRRALADAGQIRTYIDDFLRTGLIEVTENQVIAGAGGNDLTGIMNTTGTTTQAFSTDIIETARKARTKVRTTGRAKATGYGMHPTDWESFDLTQDGEDRYYFGGPRAIGAPFLWGLPVAESEGFTVGAALCAAFNYAILWERQGAEIYISDSHADFFTRNLIAVLAELRAAFGVIRPAAFVEIDLLP